FIAIKAELYPTGSTNLLDVHSPEIIIKYLCNTYKDVKKSYVSCDSSPLKTYKTLNKNALCAVFP
ncbi:MAG: hypothetical protein QW551_03700, partial [Desulfurococcaceae archaeon]